MWFLSYLGIFISLRGRHIRGNFWMISTTKSAFFRLIFNFGLEEDGWLQHIRRNDVGVSNNFLNGHIFESSDIVWFLNVCVVLQFLEWRIDITWNISLFISAGSRSTKNIRRTSLVILWRICTICLTLKLISWITIPFSFVKVKEWKFWITIRNALFTRNW